MLFDEDSTEHSSPAKTQGAPAKTPSPTNQMIMDCMVK